MSMYSVYPMALLSLLLPGGSPTGWLLEGNDFQAGNDGHMESQEVVTPLLHS